MNKIISAELLILYGLIILLTSIISAISPNNIGFSISLGLSLIFTGVYLEPENKEE
jgi:hypothetical protein